MHESFFTSDCRPRRFRATFTAYPTHIDQIEAERAAFCVWERAQQRAQFVRWMVRLWPVAAGLLLGLLAPQLRSLVARFEPWGTGVVFPIALLARRPEFRGASQIVHGLPLLAFYLQFPMEGLIVRMALRGRVTVAGVAWQVFYLHYLAAIQLIMIGGAASHALMRLG